MFSKDIVTLNIESNDVRFLVTRGSRITQWGSIPLTPGIVKNSTIANRVRVSSAIKSLFLENDLPKSNVITSLTGLRSVLRTVNLPKIKPKLLAEAIQHESEREMPISLDELYLSQQLILTAEHEQQFIVLGVPRDVLDAEIEIGHAPSIDVGVDR